MIIVPGDVSKKFEKTYIENYQAITNSTNRLMLFSADQKIEHLNRDFHGSFISPDVNNPEHLFKIANQGRIGAFATQLGLISRYGQQYKNINYLAKLNSKTNLVTTEQKDPLSNKLWNVEDVINLKNNTNLKIIGVGYTIYLGSEFENIMLSEAAQIIFQAHSYGLIAILWVYPRGKSIKDKKNIELLPGSTGVANALGADFVKINPPEGDDFLLTNDIIKNATQAAGNTKVLFSGGESKPTEIFLKELYEQISFGGSSGNATGRNIFQRPLNDAIAFTHAISAIVYDNKNIEESIKIYKEHLGLI